MKKLTLKQLEFRKEEAAGIARSAREEADRADYALQRATLEKPWSVRPFEALLSRRELMERIKGLESESEDSQSRIDEIADLVAPEEKEEEEEDEEEGNEPRRT
jgi:hypothetical protein